MQFCRLSEFAAFEAGNPDTNPERKEKIWQIITRTFGIFYVLVIGNPIKDSITIISHRWTSTCHLRVSTKTCRHHKIPISSTKLINRISEELSQYLSLLQSLDFQSEEVPIASLIVFALLHKLQMLGDCLA